MSSSVVALADYLPFGLGFNDVVALMAGLAVLATVAALWQALRSDTSFERRLGSIANKKEAMRLAALSTRRQRAHLTPAGMIHELVTRLDLLRSHHATEARMILARAGMRSRDAMVRYLFARLSLPLACAMAEMIDGYTLHLLPVPPNLRLLAAAGAAVLGFFAPGIFLKNLIAKRQKRMQLGLPDALDLMIICAEAGLSLDSTIVRVSRELQAACPDLAEELAITSAELTFLPDRRQALDNLNARTDMSAIRGVVNTLMQTAKFGTPLAQSLRVLATEYRDARMFKAEEKAARLPALMTVPMILFILPTLFIVLMGPAALSILDTFDRNGGGHKHVTVVTHNDSGTGIGAPAGTKVTEKPAEQDQPKADDRTADAGALPPASVTPAQLTAAVGEPIDVDIDARALANHYNLRVVVVPKDTTDAVAEKLFANAQDIAPVRMHFKVTARLTGPSEIRLYSIPPFSIHYAVSARTPITITAAPNPSPNPAPPK